MLGCGEKAELTLAASLKKEWWETIENPPQREKEDGKWQFNHSTMYQISTFYFIFIAAN